MNITGKLTIELPDSTQIHDADFAYFPHPWSSEQWLGLNPEQVILYSWREADTLIGFCLLGFLAGDDVAHMLKIVVLPAYKMKGNASAFWSSISDSLKSKKISRVYLEVQVTNKPAIGFYAKCGFKVLRTNKHYYSDGSDAFMMELTL